MFLSNTSFQPVNVGRINRRRILSLLLAFGAIVMVCQLLLCLVSFQDPKEVKRRAKYGNDGGVTLESNSGDIVVRTLTNMTTMQTHIQELSDNRNGSSHVRVQSESSVNTTLLVPTLQEEGGSENSQYLLPVFLGNQGFNNQFQSLKLASILAYKRGLTIVMSPFYEHQANIWLQRPRSFQESVDGDVLAKFIPVVTLEEFKQRCNNSVEAMIVGSNMVENQVKEMTDKLHRHLDEALTMFLKHTGIRMPRVSLNANNSDVVIRIAEDLPYGVPVDDFLDRYPDSLTTTEKCNAFLYPYGYLGRMRYADHIKEYTQYFARSSKVRNMARHFATHFMKNTSYLCIHWRFNEEWGKYW